MSTASCAAGVLFLVLATIARFMVQKNINIPRSRIVRLISLPSKDYPEDVYATIGQCMGILWILIGIFLAKTEKWFSSSLMGIFIEPLVTFAPFIIGGIVLRILLAVRKK